MVTRYTSAPDQADGRRLAHTNTHVSGLFCGACPETLAAAGCSIEDGARTPNAQVTAGLGRHPSQGPARRPLVTWGRGLRTTERAGAHSLQFGTYAPWTAGLLAALAVRPVPSCILSLARGVNDQAPNDVCPGQTLTPS